MRRASITNICMLLAAVLCLSIGISLAQTVASGQESGAAGEMPEMKVHKVLQGEDLHLIAAKYYNNPREWTAIYEANKDSIANPDLIYPGQIIYIPQKP